MDNVRPKVLLADDNNILLQGLKSLLVESFDIACTASDGREAVAAALRAKPDIAVLDVGLPSLNGIEAAQQIHRAAPEMKIVLLTQYSDRAYVTAAFRAGASGYVLKQSATSELKAALFAALQGQYFVSAALGDVKGFSIPKENEAGERGGSPLTIREREILQMLAEGKDAKTIATALGISLKTVEFHISNMMDNLGLFTDDDLTLYAVQRVVDKAKKSGGDA